MSVVPFRHYPLDADSSWSFTAAEGNAVIEKLGWAGFKAAHTIFDPSEGSVPESKAAYKLPHHKLDSNGRMVTVWRGVVAAAAALVGARGGVDASSADKQAAARHLIQHYREFEMDPPEALLKLAGSQRMSDLKTPYESPLPVAVSFDEGMNAADRLANLAKALLHMDGLEENDSQTIKWALKAIAEGGTVSPEAVRTILRISREREIHFVGRPDSDGVPSIIVSSGAILGHRGASYPVPPTAQFSTQLGRPAELNYPYPFPKEVKERWEDLPKPASLCEFGKNCVAVEGEGETASFCSDKIDQCPHALQFGCPEKLKDVSTVAPSKYDETLEAIVSFEREGEAVSRNVPLEWNGEALTGFFAHSLDNPDEGFQFSVPLDLDSEAGAYTQKLDHDGFEFTVRFTLDAPIRDAAEYLNGAPGQIARDYLASLGEPAPDAASTLSGDSVDAGSPDEQDEEKEEAVASNTIKYKVEVDDTEIEELANKVINNITERFSKEGAELCGLADTSEPEADPAEVTSEFSEYPDIASAPTFAVPDVEIFDTGAWHGEPWTVADLDEMVRNADRLRLTIKPPVKLGHSNAILERQGREDDSLPAVGWIENIRRIGTKILADFTNVPKVVFDLIMKGAYKRVSSEILLEYVDRKTGERFGKVLRAVSLLGAAIPEVKTLRDVAALYSEDVQEADPGTVTKVFNFTVEGGKIVDTEKLQAKLEEKDALLADREKAIQNKEAEIKASEEAAAQAEQVKAELEAKFAAEKEALQAQLAEQKQFLAAIQEQHRNERREARARETEIFFETLTGKGILAPACKEQVTRIFSAAYELQDEAGREKVAAFSEGIEGGSLVEGLKVFLKSLPKQVDFSEVTGKASEPKKDGTPAGAPKSTDISDELSQHAAEGGKVVNFTDYRGDVTPMTGLSLDERFTELRKANPGMTVEEAMVAAEKSLVG